jgi:hypothetical protein
LSCEILKCCWLQATGYRKKCVLKYIYSRNVNLQQPVARGQ